MINNEKGGIILSDTEKFMSDIEKRVYTEFLNKEISILTQGNLDNNTFKLLYETEYKNYSKELKKTLRSAYKNIFNPYRTLEDLEYIWAKYVFIGVLSEEYVIKQRSRLYDNMRNPTDDIKLKVQKIKEKINNRFKK